jgi:hypothetical protein
MGREQLAALLDAEVQTRVEEIGRYRDRDRREDWDPAIPFDQELAESVKECLHRMGSSAMDAHVAALSELRAELLNVPPSTKGP